MKIFIVNGQGGSGKALCNSTILPTPMGKRKVGEIKVGDYLFDRHGKPTKVLGVFPQGEREVYEISFKDGRKAKCSRDHLWNIHKQSWHREKSKNKFVPYTLKQIEEEGIKISEKQGYRFSVQCADPVIYPKKKNKIHPYVIGAFLGDGCCLERRLTISSIDAEIVEKINSLIGGTGYRKLSDNNFSWIFFDSSNNKKRKDIKYFQTEVFFSNYKKEICQYSYNKRIPEDYKYTDLNSRISLIQGLFDTDGSIDKKGNITFTSTSYQLILDVKEVLGSLGYVSSIYEDKRDKYTQKCYSLHVFMDNKEKPKLFSLLRKKEIALKLSASNFSYNSTRITQIKDLGYKEEMTCFLVDNDEHLFLMNDFIVTHNTTFEKFIKSYAWNSFFKEITITSIIDPIKQVAKGVGWSGAKSNKDRAFLHDLKTLLHNYNHYDMRYIENKIRCAAELRRTAIFIDMREKKDIEYLKRLYPEAITILIRRGEPISYGNAADDNIMDIDYDIIIDNDGTLNELKEKAIDFYNKEISNGN